MRYFEKQSSGLSSEFIRKALHKRLARVGKLVDSKSPLVNPEAIRTEKQMRSISRSLTHDLKNYEHNPNWNHKTLYEYVRKEDGWNSKQQDMAWELTGSSLYDLKRKVLGRPLDNSEIDSTAKLKDILNR